MQKKNWVSSPKYARKLWNNYVQAFPRRRNCFGAKTRSEQEVSHAEIICPYKFKTIQHMTHDWSRGEQWILFPEKLTVSPDLLYSKTKPSHLQLHALITCNSGQHFAGDSELFPVDVIVFAMLPANGIWRETVSLSDVTWPWTSQWMGVLWREKCELYNNPHYQPVGSLLLWSFFVSQKCTMESKTDSRYLGVSVDVGKTEKRNRHHVQLLARFNFAENKATQVTRNITGAQERLSNEMKEAIKHLTFFNPFLPKGFPIDE